MTRTSPFVVSADWLQERLGKPGLSIVDGSWYLPAQKRDPLAEYDAAHVPGCTGAVVVLIGQPPHRSWLRA